MSSNKQAGKESGKSGSQQKSGGNGDSNHKSSRDKFLSSTLGLPKEFDDVPRLIRSERTRQADNLPEFLNKMYVAMLATVGSIAIVLTTSDWPFHEPIEEPSEASITPPPAGTDIAGVRLKMYVTKLQNRERLIEDEQNAQRPKAFSYLMKCLPDVFLIEIESTDNYTRDVYNKQDFRELVRRLKSIAGSDPTDKTITAYAYRREYYEKCKQSADESLEKYYQRVRDHVERCADSEVILGSAQNIAMDFIGGADPARYEQSKLDLQNQVKIGNAHWPATLQAAYRRLADYVVPVLQVYSTTALVSGSVFFSAASGKQGGKQQQQQQQKKKKSNDKKSGEKKTDGDSKSTAESNSSSSEESDSSNSKGKSGRKFGPCPFCKLEGHRMLDCPELKVCKDISDNRKSGKAMFTRDEDEDDNDIANYAISNFRTRPGFLTRNLPEIPDLGRSNPEPQIPDLPPLEGVVHVAHPEIFKPTQVLLDNQSTVDLFFNADLLTDIHTMRKPVRIGGIGPGALLVTERGTFRDYGKVYLHEDAQANVLCFGSAARDPSKSVGYLPAPDNAFVLTTPSMNLRFEHSDDLYVCDLAEAASRSVFPPPASSLVTTTSENKLKYTKIQVDAANEAGKLLELFGYRKQLTALQMHDDVRAHLDQFALEQNKSTPVDLEFQIGDRTLDDVTSDDDDDTDAEIPGVEIAAHAVTPEAATLPFELDQPTISIFALPAAPVAAQAATVTALSDFVSAPASAPVADIIEASAPPAEPPPVRIVAGGNQQDKSLYEDISSPTVATTAVFMIAAIAAKEKRTAVTAYIGDAYLNADTCVRPDMLTTNAFLASRVQEPTENDWEKLERLLKYLNGTKTLGLALSADKDLSVLAYVDASYGVHWDAKSHTGALISLGKGAIYSKSSKQKLVSKSSTEAELIGLSDSFTQAIWTRDFLIEQGYKVGPATVYQDNKSTIALAEKGRSTSDRTRHIHIRYYFVKDRIDSGEVRIEYLQTDLMLADILTKPLQGELFRRLRDQLLNWDE